MNMSTRKMANMALLIALGIILPVGLHFFGPDMGSLLSPMHLPVFLAGALLGPAAGVLVGGITPVLSSVFTGMPPVIPMLPIMFFELMIYGLTVGYFYHQKKYNIYTSLILSMILGRIMAGIVVFFLVQFLNITYLPVNPLVFIWGTIAKGFPGIVIQLILIPLIVRYLPGDFKAAEKTFS